MPLWQSNQTASAMSNPEAELFFLNRLSSCCTESRRHCKCPRLERVWQYDFGSERTRLEPDFWGSRLGYGPGLCSGRLGTCPRRAGSRFSKMAAQFLQENPSLDMGHLAKFADEIHSQNPDNRHTSSKHLPCKHKNEQTRKHRRMAGNENRNRSS